LKGMKRTVTVLLLLAALSSCATLNSHHGSYRATHAAVRSDFPRSEFVSRQWVSARIRHEGAVFNVFAWKREGLNTRLLLYRDPSGKRAFARLERAVRRVESSGEEVLLAANAGMYADDLSPLGLYRERGEELVPLNASAGEGNFGLRPNGVFYFGKEGFGVAETEAFAAGGEPARSLYASQSGPLLLSAGAVHPGFAEGSDNRYIRSGVGVSGRGYRDEVYFAVSEGPVNFHQFALFFRDVLGCSEALYLDGHTSRARIPSLGRLQEGGRFGPILVVSDPSGRDRFSVDMKISFYLRQPGN
jgi:uncharacterized protein YigE (DUF2233 family)